MNSGDKFDQIKTWRHPELSIAQMYVYMHDPYAHQHTHASFSYGFAYGAHMCLHIPTYTYMYVENTGPSVLTTHSLQSPSCLQFLAHLLSLSMLCLVYLKSV